MRGLALVVLLASFSWADPQSITLQLLRADPFSSGIESVETQALPADPAADPVENFTGVVSKVLDADTIIVDYQGGRQVRFAAVDAPEIAHPEHGKEGQPYGEESAAFVRGLLQGRKVKVKIDETDRYGRGIGWVTLSDGRSVQEELLRGGWAWWNFFFNHDQALNKLENDAIKAGRGLWAGKARGGVYHPEAPWVFRRRVDAGIRRVLPGEEAEFKFTHMPDADTAALGLRQGVYDYIRLAGIDAPEVSHGRTRPGQPYGPEAGMRASELVQAEGMVLKVKIEDVDAYGRIVGWIELKSRGETLNEILVEEGFAWWYERYYPDLADLGRKQAAAKSARRGLWADPNPIPPWDFRRDQRGGRSGKDSVDSAELASLAFVR